MQMAVLQVLGINHQNRYKIKTFFHLLKHKIILFRDENYVIIADILQFLLCLHNCVMYNVFVYKIFKLVNARRIRRIYSETKEYCRIRN